MTTDASRYFDIMDFHAYGQTPDSVLSRYRSFRRSMHSNPAWAAKPIWVEFGFNSSWSDKGGYSGTEGQKARNFVKATKLVSAAGAQGPIFWFTLHGNNPDSPGYGLITRDSQDLSRRRLKAFYALRDMPAPSPARPARPRRHRPSLIDLAPRRGAASAAEHDVAACRPDDGHGAQPAHRRPVEPVAAPAGRGRWRSRS